jgi:hypothetical protein
MPLRSSSEFDPKDLAALEDRIAPDADLARIPGKCFVGRFFLRSNDTRRGRIDNGIDTFLSSRRRRLFQGRA